MSFAIRAILLCGSGLAHADTALPVPAANWISAGQASREVTAHALTIHQHTDKAILNWQSFDIGQDKAVHFKQPGAASIALNRIAPSTEPSRILGKLDANGQVYLVNPSGFVFGEKSRVNVNSLVATTLNITDEVFDKGLTKAINQSQGAEPVAALSGSGEVYRKDAQGRIIMGADGQPQKIKIATQPGADLKTNAPGGRILLAAPSIQNSGSLAAPDGQVILAAATDKVYLQEADPQSNLRGILVEVKTGGDVQNLGKLSAERGNVTAVGYAVYQQGRASASTSVNLNGTVRLLAREGGTLERSSDGALHLVPGATRRSADTGDGLGAQATVRLAADSQTRVDLDASGGKAVDEQAQTPSQVEISGGKIIAESGAAVMAPGGKISLTASENPAHPMLATTPGNASRIVLEPGSRLDAAGSRQTVVPMERNVVAVELRDHELRDAPLQKDGILHGQTVSVDVRQGALLADIEGAIARIERSVQERNSTGGSVTLASEGDVLFDQGAVVDVSGGAVRYRDGWINTTQLLSQGRVYDIATADPNRHYDGLFGQFSRVYDRWHLSRTWNIPGLASRGRFEAGYTEGKSAGSVAIQARNLAMDGTVRADAVASRYQRQESQRPAGGELSIDLAWSGQPQQAVVFRNSAEPLNLSSTNPFPSSTHQGGDLPAIILGRESFQRGVQRLSINTAGHISIDPETNLVLPDGGRLSLTGGALDIDSHVTAPAGGIALTTRQAGGGAVPLSGDIRLGSGAVLDVAGWWVNDQPGSQAALIPTALPINGGTLSLEAFGNLTLAPGSRLNADGGAWLPKTGKLTAGNGGEIALGVAGNGPTKLELGGELSAYGLEQGGKLSITANALDIGENPAATDALNLTPDFLTRGGFTQIALTANGGALTVEPETQLDLRAQTRRLNADYLTQPTGTALAEFSHIGLLPEYFRRPINLSLNLAHDANVGGNGANHILSVGTGATISTDPGGRIALESDTSLRIDGTLSAPAGRIDLALNAITATLDRAGYDPNQAIRLGAAARLLSPGAFVAQPNNQGLILGEVQPGGTVSLTAHRGYVLMDESAVIDVSGTAASLDLATGDGGWVGRVIPSDGGSIQLTAAEGIAANGKLLGQAGDGPGASGGSLAITLDAQQRSFNPYIFASDAPPVPASPRVVHLTTEPGFPLADGAAWDGAIASELNGQAYLGTEQVGVGGFASLSLQAAVMTLDTPPTDDITKLLPQRGEIRFDGDVSLNLAKQLTLDAPVLAWSRPTPDATGNVRLAANTVRLGSSLTRQAHAGTSGGDGALTVEANWLDLIGATEMQGFHQTRLGSRHDIRLIGINPNAEGDLLGQFSAAGEIDLAARQVYPSTFSQFAIHLDASQSPGGWIRLASGNPNAQAPLSAGGQLKLTAPNIESQGVIRAPLGQIDIQAGQSLELAPGSLTSISAKGLTIPFGRTQGGLDWLFPLGNASPVMSAPPQKSIHLAAPAVNLADGATVDLSGGGDLLAFEFIKGPGGSVDALDPSDPGYASGGFSYQEKFAIVPTRDSGFASYDPIASPASGLSVGDSIYLSAGSKLPAGRYALLPAHYALLPGAFLVTPQAGTTDIPAGSHTTRLDGSLVVAGYRYTEGTSFRAARWSGFAVEPGSLARTRSEYQINLASRFYTDKAKQTDTATPRLPMDAGTLAIAANKTLALAGQIAAAPEAGGRGGRLDIAAANLAIVQTRADAIAQPSTGVVLAADDLNRLGVESLLLGGRRRDQDDDDATRLDVAASEVAVNPGVRLQGQDIFLVAKDRVTVGENATLQAEGKTAAGAGEGVIRVGAASGDFTGAALLRISTGPQADIQPDALADTPRTGSLSIGAGAILATDGSLYLVGSVDNRVQGDIRMNGGALALAAGRISLGEAPESTAGLVLGESLLNGLAVDELRLTSLSSLDFYGAVDVAAKSLVIDGAGLQGHGQSGDAARITGNSVAFTNTMAAAGTGTAEGQGGLSVSARQIQLGGGDQTWQGFQSIDLAATDGVIAAGTSSLNLAGNLHISTGKLAAEAGANLSLNAGNHGVIIDRLSGGKPADIADGLGASVAIQAGSINLAAPVVLPAGSLKLAATGDIALTDGAAIDVSGRAVTLGSQTVYANGGAVALSSAAGDVSLASGASVNVAAASGGGEAGSLKLAAGQGRITLDGGLTGQSGQNGAGGSFSLDAQSLVGLDFSALNTKLAAAGFDQSLAVRLRLGDLLIAGGDTVRAADLHLTADVGSLTVSGAVDASGPAGGRVNLDAGSSVTLADKARILAQATTAGEDGGEVRLNSLGSVNVAAGASIDVSAGTGGKGGTVAARAGRIGDDDAAVSIAPGTVTGAASLTVEAVRIYRDESLTNAQLAAWRDDAASYMDAAAKNAKLQTRLGGFTLTPGLEIQSSGDLRLDLSDSLQGNTWARIGGGNVWTTRLDNVAGAVSELVQTGTDGTARALTPGDSSQLSADGSYYFDADPNSPSFRQLFVRVFLDTRLSGASRYDPAAIHASLTESNGWDFSLPDAQGKAWRFGPAQVPGQLTLRAAGDLTLARSLSDGFVTYTAASLAEFFGLSGPAPAWLDTQRLQTGESWSYRLTAGADLSSADPLATADAAHDLVIGAGAAVRTGTGTIDAAASGDIRLTDARSTLYTAGRPTDTARYGSFDLSTVSRAFYAEYPVDGGAIRLSAGRDVVGVATPQLMSDWLVRTGSWNPDDGLTSQNRPTAWGIAFDNLVVASSPSAQIKNLKFGFRENIGALGGGAVTVKADGAVRDLSVMLPSTAKPVGEVSNGQIIENRWQVQGGGDLTVTAGGDIAGGVFYVDRGTARLTSHGRVTGGTQYTAGPLFGLGDAQVSVNAAQGIAVGTAFNPFSLTAPKYTDKTAYFTSYSAASALSLQTAAGDVVLNNDAATIQREYRLFDAANPKGRNILTGLNELRMLTLYPGSLSAAALSGGLRVGRSFDLFPAAAGQLALLADGDIHFDQTEQVVINQSDADPSLLLSPAKPAVSLNDTVKRLDIFNLNNASFLHAAAPVHGGDTAPVIIASARGDIVADHASLLSTAKAAEISAGRDLVGLGLQIQNLAATDVTQLRAGRDIRFPVLRDALTGQLDSNINDLPIAAAGPGQLQVLAGRNLDLGTSAGITTLGNLTNPALPTTGAAISVWAGLNQAADYAGFIKAYLDDSSAYGESLAGYMRVLTGAADLDPAAALAQFKALPEARQQAFILAVLFQELKASGIAAAGQTDPAQKAAEYRRGENAIAALFPGDGYQGDIRLFFSKIQTLAGGDINLLAPGGLLDVGLASAFSGNKTAADLGVVAQGAGHVAALAAGDVRVNQSRIFTLGGGDITLWSERGDIDAGRGAKAALAAPAPIYGFDAQGNLVVTFPPAVSGSGIRAQSGAASAAGFGDVTLVAPRGVVNTGEAGIGGENVAIAATAIIGVANIQATGSLTGAPPPVPSMAAGLTSAGNLLAGTSGAAQSSLNDSLAAAREAAQLAPSIAPVKLLSVEVVGFGACNLTEIREGKPGC